MVRVAVSSVAWTLLSCVFPPALAADEWPEEPPILRWNGASVQVDGNTLKEDSGGTASDMFLRRAIVSVSARLSGWTIKLEPGFVGGYPTDDHEFVIEDAYVATRLGPGEIVAGQRRPFRGMEDLTASEEILLLERPFAGAGGLFGGPGQRDFVLGVFFHGSHDHYGWGLGAYSLKTLTSGREGAGAAARVTYAPLIASGEALHFGFSASYEEPEDVAVPGAPSTPAAAVSYAGRSGPVAVLASMGPGEPVATLGAEFGFALGPWFGQAEFMAQRLEQAAGRDAQTVLAYYAQGSYFVTGETKPYDVGEGVFHAPSPLRAGGAWELVARYDGGGNRDPGSIPEGCGGKVLADRCEVQAVTLGANYYFTRRSRLMLNYTMAEWKRGRAGKDTPEALAARVQVSF